MFQFPVSQHITTYFVRRTDSRCFENFEEGLEIPIEVQCLVYVPDSIICGVCLPDPDVIDIENKIPHITLYVANWAPRFSNNVLEALFIGKDAPLRNKIVNNKL